MNHREAILSGVMAAAELHDRLDIQETIESGLRGNVDVFDSILKQGAKLLFRPLQGLLGACLQGPGVLISTNRPLSVQRFTGAHELCHVVKHHSISLDGEEILTAQLAEASEHIEIEANSFAAEFLLPRWLFVHHAKRQGWTSDSMEKPQNVYQMSLRVGASYEATVFSLAKHDIISRSHSKSLLQITPKSIKQALLPGYSPQNWFRDVWLITDKDQGTFIEGQPDDLFHFQLSEKSGAGYLWNFEALKKNGFVVVNDERKKVSGDSIGGDVLRILTAHSPEEPKGDLNLGLRRPWQSSSASADELRFQYNLLGKEKGLPRSMRPEYARAA